MTEPAYDLSSISAWWTRRDREATCSRPMSRSPVRRFAAIEAAGCRGPGARSTRGANWCCREASTATPTSKQLSACRHRERRYVRERDRSRQPLAAPPQ